MRAVIALDGTLLDDAYFASLRAQRELIAHESLVRGRLFFEWSEVIDQYKRAGQLDDALILACECMDAATRVLRIQGGQGAGGWTREVAIILRKLKNYEAEVDLIERAIANGGCREDVSSRLPTARKLLAKSVASATLAP